MNGEGLGLRLEEPQSLIARKKKIKIAKTKKDIKEKTWKCVVKQIKVSRRWWAIKKNEIKIMFIRLSSVDVTGSLVSAVFSKAVEIITMMGMVVRLKLSQGFRTLSSHFYSFFLLFRLGVFFFIFQILDFLYLLLYCLFPIYYSFQLVYSSFLTGPFLCL